MILSGRITLKERLQLRQQILSLISQATPVFATERDKVLVGLDIRQLQGHQ
jgi:hypothetical protein